jgi:predicted Zn-dependent protease
MNKKVLFGVLVAVMMLAVAMAGCTSSTNSSTNSSSTSAVSGYQTYANATAGVSMQYPSGWNVSEGTNGSIATFSPLTGNASVSVGALNESFFNMTLSEYRSNVVLAANLSGSNETVTNTTIAGMPAFTFTNTTTYPSGITKKETLIATEKNGQLYTIIYEAAPEVFATYQSNFTAMVNSFAFTS